MRFIHAEKLGYEYLKDTEEESPAEKIRALSDVDLDVEKGEFIAILGHNGSGKSTLARLINALLIPTDGTIFVGGMNTADAAEIWKIRESAGMVFQNPDNQIIASVVEEDVGFGPENMGVPSNEIWERVEEALSKVGMLAYRESSPDRLSGGQKQRVAIAGVLAMKPECIVLDEPTAMLDPGGRREVLATVKELNEKEGVTVILITHYMEETIDADRLIVMNGGRIIMQGTPREVFSQSDRLKEVRMDVPQITELADRLRADGIDIPAGILSAEELADALAGAPAEEPSEVPAEEPAEVLTEEPSEAQAEEPEKAKERSETHG